MRVSTIDGKTYITLNENEEITVLTEKSDKAILVRNNNGLSSIKTWHTPKGYTVYDEDEAKIMFNDHYDNLEKAYEQDDSFISTKINRWMQNVNTYRLILLTQPSLMAAEQVLTDSIGANALMDSSLTNEQLQEMYDEEMLELATAYYLLCTEGYEKDGNRIKLFYNPTPKVEEYIKKYVKRP